MARSIQMQLAVTALSLLISATLVIVRGWPPGMSIQDAAAKGDLKELRRNLSWGVDVNSSGRAGFTALHEACLQGQLPAAEFLIARGADVSAWTSVSATYRERPSFDPSPYREATAKVIGPIRETPLHWAARSGNLKLVELLMAHGADVNAVAWRENDEPATPLHVARMYGREGVCRLLLRHGARE